MTLPVRIIGVGLAGREEPSFSRALEIDRKNRDFDRREEEVTDEIKPA